MKLLIIDNYDSFTYNLVHAVRQAGQPCDVVRNDAIDLERVSEYDKLIISPGPGIPSEAGLMPEVLRRYAAEIPILGVCLGHQALGERFGAQLVNLPEVYHGLSRPVNIIADDYLFEGLPARFDVGRYHSWAISPEGFPEQLQVTATSDEGHIMAIRHKDLDIRGVQFHPESILTPLGQRIIENWLRH
ncbi:MAG: aminodeoxychorismate/anthranilate synthase component II [Bacteroidales bacterium]|nr:aminodeoxychorismate/anthranilate synthase component II [Bacteroidales bacterium]